VADRDDYAARAHARSPIPCDRVRGVIGIELWRTAATVWTVAAVIDQNNVQVNVGAVGVGPT